MRCCSGRAGWERTSRPTRFAVEVRKRVINNNSSSGGALHGGQSSGHLPQPLHPRLSAHRSRGRRGEGGLRLPSAARPSRRDAPPRNPGEDGGGGGQEGVRPRARGRTPYLGQRRRPRSRCPHAVRCRPAQMQAFLDATGGHWVKGALIGKVGSAFTSTASQHGGQETTLIQMHTFFYHQGMVVAGVPYAAQELLNLDEISGGTPYRASTVAGPRGERTPTANELAIARFQGRHVAQLAAKLSAR